jgi:hypothetical protein
MKDDSIFDGIGFMLAINAILIFGLGFGVGYLVFGL